MFVVIGEMEKLLFEGDLYEKNCIYSSLKNYEENEKNVGWIRADVSETKFSAVPDVV